MKNRKQKTRGAAGTLGVENTPKGAQRQGAKGTARGSIEVRAGRMALRIGFVNKGFHEVV